MIIYIPLEIVVRELQAHLLFASIAASEGHQVLIASSSDLWLYKRLKLLKSGSFLFKNVNVPRSSEKMYKSLIKDSFDLYCHEQEPPILYDTFKNYLHVRNIYNNQFLPFKAVFCWGKRDTKGYKDFFKKNKNIFVNTGSPRSDLWNKNFQPLRNNSDIENMKSYFLVISNFGSSMGNRNWTEWLSVGRKNETITSKKDEDELIKFILQDSAIAINIVQAIRYLAKEYPEKNIIVRPHPGDDIKNWHNIARKFKNIYVVDTEIPLSSWISKASVIIQNGCTSALEAVYQKKPVISFGSQRDSGSIAIPSKVSLICEKIDDLKNKIEVSLSNEKYLPTQTKSEKLLKEIISNYGNSSFKMLKTMNDRSNFEKTIKITTSDIYKIKLVRFSKNFIDMIRSNIFSSKHCKPAYQLNPVKIKADLKIIVKCAKVVEPRIIFIGKTGILIS